MRILSVLCGIAVLLISLHFAHALHRFYSQASPQDLQSPFFWAGMVLAVIVGTVAAIGGCLLLLRGR